ncbi:phage tail-collar fiber domain-containing protein [Morganella morganii]|uniref:phage tail-collar fiber domain-containing protein n=1 Tax=Morganella morganii TaxID=582 RepID=UPI0034D3B644
MTAKYFAILTNYGAAQLANAVALGTQMNISAMAVGDGGGTLPVPDPAQTKLVREKRRAAVNQVSVDEKNPNFIIAEQVIPENEGGWWIREIGLFDDNGGLIAVGNAPETYKPNLQEGSGRTQVIQVVLMVSSTQAITLKVDPSVVLATREYVTKSIDAAIQASEARAAQTYQRKGDYVTNSHLKLELLKKIDKADITQQLGNDTGKVVSQNLLTTELGKKASVADANSKLAKNQNGADIPDKPKFIENLGLTELLNKKFDKAGGVITASGQALAIRDIDNAQESYIGFLDASGYRRGMVGYANGKDDFILSNTRSAVTLKLSSDGKALIGNSEIYSGLNTKVDRNGNLKVSGSSDALSDCPVGSPIPWPQSAAPTGFLVCNGQTFNKITYPLLAAAYPSGKLPDLRSEFIRGLDAGRNIDSARTVLSAQDDTMQNIIGSFSVQRSIVDGFTGVFFGGDEAKKGNDNYGGDIGRVVHFDASRMVRTSNENRPRNIAFLYIVRAA